MSPDITTGQRQDPLYLMGRSTRETERLIFVGKALNPFTRRLFHDAGLAPGMRVLDVGCGAGDVALLAADVVGPTGRVVGLDANPEILRSAFDRAQATGLDNVSFVAGDCRETPPPGPFDAIVGRLVLMYLADPAQALRSLTDQLAPGGIVAFQDYNLSPPSCRISPAVPLWEQAWRWVVDTAASAAIPAEVGFQLRRIFHQAGLPEPEMRLDSYVGGGPDSIAYTWMAESVRSMLPLILHTGTATTEEIDVDTLADRLRAAAVAADAVAKSPDLVSAWTRIG
jgi:ubiquinone/menaquinone biosynthesis C-methylase UbiE